MQPLQIGSISSDADIVQSTDLGSYSSFSGTFWFVKNADGRLARMLPTRGVRLLLVSVPRLPVFLS